MPSPEAVVRMRRIWVIVNVMSLVASTARTSPSNVGVTVANGRVQLHRGDPHLLQLKLEYRNYSCIGPRRARSRAWRGFVNETV